MDYTKSQQEVLDTHHTNLLVSASAGSGKTRVLVDRVINMILDHESIDHLLIVTFTRAAAKEMKDRIESALKQQVNQVDADERRYLTRQLAMLPVASISTMDAFCQQIVERYYYLIDLDPVFRILGDATESALLQEEVWDDVREDLYATDDDGQFQELVANFSSDRSDDGLTTVVSDVFRFMGAKPDPDDWLAHLGDTYAVGDDLMAAPIVKTQLLPIIQDKLANAKTELTAAKNLAADEQVDQVAAYLDTLLDQLAGLHPETTSWNQFREQVQAFDWGRLPTIRKTNDAYEGYQLVKDQVASHKKAAKESQLDEILSFMTQNETDTIATMHHSEQMVRKLATVVKQFSDAYAKEKRRRHVLEFSDVEHFALQILQTQTSEAQAVRHQLQTDYHEIMVDEYQDTNELQEAIVTALAQKNPGNLFMVGDIKQSIYRFRLAEPKLFLTKFQRYQADPTAGKEITLAENFRSMANVDNFTNLIFTQIMDEHLGQISYSGAAKLVYGASYPENLPNVASLLIYETEAPTDKAPGDIPDKNAGQVTIVAQKINDLMTNNTEIWDRRAQAMRPLAYQDIAIIAPTKANNLEIQDQFGRLNIPVQINDAQSYFKTTEIQIMMSLLQLIDNPYQDIPLAAVLRSPIVGLNENELAFLRITDKTDDYFSALQHFMLTYEEDYAGQAYADSLQPKVAHFLDQLTAFQSIARKQPLATLIWQIYQQTGFLDYVAGMPAGAQRQANLHALYERAADYERNGFKGLFQFVRFIERMQNNDQDLAEAAAQTTDNAVQVMTIHGSKGLEYPIVFLLDTSRNFNMQDTTGRALLNNQLGIGIDDFQPESRMVVESIPKAVIKVTTKQESLAEEMRKLYVALTRAEQQLYVVGACKQQADLLKTWQAAAQDDQLVLNPSLREKTHNYLDWIGMSLIRHPKFQSADAQPLPALADDPTDFALTFVTPDNLTAMAAYQKPMTGSVWLDDLKKQIAKTDFASVDVDKIDDILNMQYGYEPETRTTAYQSVSEIKRLFEDPDMLQLGQYNPKWQQSHGNRFVTSDFRQPAFLQTVTAPIAAEVGTATHLVLQELNLEQPITTDVIDHQIQTLVANQVMAAPVAEQIDRGHVQQLFDTELGKAIVAHGNGTHRETPFSLLLPANQVFQDLHDDQAKILIHGIIDGYFEDADGITLFDYKTDHVIPGDKGVAKIKDRYSGQLNLYAQALSDMTGKPVVHKYLFLLSTGEALAM